MRGKRKKRRIGVRASCSIQLLHALSVTFRYVDLFATLKCAHPDYDIDFLLHHSGNFIEVCYCINIREAIFIRDIPK